MDKIGIVFLAILGGVIIGLIVGFVVGPIYLNVPDAVLGLPDESELRYENEHISENDNDNEYEEITPLPEHDVPAMADHPLVGKWEVINLVDIDPHNIDEIGSILEYFEDGTGIEHHSEEPLMREITWEAEGGRLTITPKDASYRIRSYDYEIEDNVFTIFFNRNRTSYFEAMRIPS